MERAGARDTSSRLTQVGERAGGMVERNSGTRKRSPGAERTDIHSATGLYR